MGGHLRTPLPSASTGASLSKPEYCNRKLWQANQFIHSINPVPLQLKDGRNTRETQMRSAGGKLFKASRAYLGKESVMGTRSAWETGCLVKVIKKPDSRNISWRQGSDIVPSGKFSFWASLWSFKK